MNNPQICLLRWRPFRLPMNIRFQAAGGKIDAREGVLVQLEDEEGRRGVGEASPMPSTDNATTSHVVSLLERYGPSLLQGNTERLDGSRGSAALRCAIDIAMLDLRARVAEVPVAALLSKDHASSVQVNAVIGGGPPDDVAHFGQLAMESGYSVLKLKVGLTSLEEDASRVSALREACPEATIRLDANGAWDEVTALRAFEMLYQYQIELLEQPTPPDDIEALARLRSQAPMRIAADESVEDPKSFERLLELHAVDFIVLKPMFVGGVSCALTLAERAAEHSIGSFATSTFDSSIGIATALHLAAALPTDAAQGLGTGAHLGADVVSRTLLPRAGRLAIPNSSGLGIEAETEALESVALGPWVEVEVGT